MNTSVHENDSLEKDDKLKNGYVRKQRNSYLDSSSSSNFSDERSSYSENYKQSPYSSTPNGRNRRSENYGLLSHGNMHNQRSSHSENFGHSSPSDNAQTTRNSHSENYRQSPSGNVQKRRSSENFDQSPSDNAQTGRNSYSENYRQSPSGNVQKGRSSENFGHSSPSDNAQTGRNSYFENYRQSPLGNVQKGRSSEIFGHSSPSDNAQTGRNSHSENYRQSPSGNVQKGRSPRPENYLPYSFASSRGNQYERSSSYREHEELKKIVDQYFNKRMQVVPPTEGWALPRPETMFTEPHWTISKFLLMKSELNDVKTKLDHYKLEKWHRHTRFMNKAGKVQYNLRNLIKPELLTQAWCKFYENAMAYKLIPSLVDEEKSLVSIHLCEAPGAFITSLNHYLRLNHPDIKWKWLATTLNPYYEGNPLSNMINDDRFILKTMDCWSFGVDYTGDLMQLYNLDHLVQLTEEMGKVLLVTADGSIDCQEDPGEQENVVSSLHYCEAVTALHILATGGSFLIKMFTMYEEPTISLMYLLCNSFNSVTVNKPATSKEGNSEVYVVCLGFKGFHFIKPYLYMLRKHYGPDRPQTAMFRKEDIPVSFRKSLHNVAEFFMKLQNTKMKRWKQSSLLSLFTRKKARVDEERDSVPGENYTDVNNTEDTHTDDVNNTEDAHTDDANLTGDKSRKQSSLLSLFTRKKARVDEEHTEERDSVPGENYTDVNNTEDTHTDDVNNTEDAHTDDANLTGDKSRKQTFNNKDYTEPGISNNDKHDIENIDNFDIGLFINKPPTDDLVKQRCLEQPWMPERNFKFPVKEGKRKLSFQYNWFDLYPWLVYSKLLNGALCKVCVLFAKSVGGRGDQRLGALVVKPHNDLNHAKEDFNNHEKKKYHLDAMSFADNFLKTMNGKQLPITSQLDLERQRVIVENHAKLSSIIKTIILCGRQEFSLRGNNDYGAIGQSEPLTNDGNFRALLRFKAENDEVLRKHLEESAGTRSMFTSPLIQNEIIQYSGEIIQEKIVLKVNTAECFSVLADETQDIARKEQLGICVRYLQDFHGKSILKEDFLGFVHVKDVTAAGLASSISSTLLNLGIDCEKLIGQGYDGASVMSGKFKGVRTIIAEKYAKAQYVHCAAHSLNLVLVHSCEINSIRNCLGTVKSVINFFRESSLRDSVLQDAAEECKKRHHTLIKLCETRWVEKHKSISRFVELYPVVLKALEDLQSSHSRDVAQQAFQLFHSVTSGEFVISLLVLDKIFSYTNTLCLELQKVNTDLVQCCDHVNTIVLTLKELRENSTKFEAIYIAAEKLLAEVGEEIRKPRIVGRQVCRNNAPGETAQKYYRINVFLPFLDHVLMELNSRFSGHNAHVANLQFLLPNKCQRATTESFKTIFEIFESMLGKFSGFDSELKMWIKKWETVGDDDKPGTVLEAIDTCNRTFYPNIHQLLKILATLPVSTATPERMFSTLKRLKSWLRNSTGDDRLTGLALLSVHRDIEIKTEDVIARLASRRKRLNILL